MYYCKVCDQIDEKGLSGHHTRCNPVVDKVVNIPIRVVDTVVHASNRVVDNRHGKYADQEARKKYQRDWIKKKREARNVDLRNA